MVTGNSNAYRYDSVPATAELENNSNQKKYVVNGTPKGHIVISKVAAVFIILGMLLLLALAIAGTYFLTPGCAVDPGPEKLMKKPGTETEIVVDERLPTSLKPLKYKLEIMPFLEEGNFTTAGTVRITFECKEQTDVIVFNIKDITIRNDTVKVHHVDEDGKYQREIVVNDQRNLPKSEMYEVHLAEDLKIAKYYEIHIKYTGNLNDLMQGFYRSQYTDTVNNRTRWLASTQFSPTDARRAFPCFDEPAMKARFQISIAHSDEYTALSNMPFLNKVPIPDMPRWAWDHFAETPEMSTYIVALTVSDMKPFYYNKTGTPFMLWARRDALEQTLYAGRIGPLILKYFEDYFKIPFPLPKIDIVAVPDFGYSAMENWGLITFREKALLFSEKLSTITDKTNIAAVLSHELAHQWFGNLVTPQWWNDVWLKEGFATYLEYMAIDHVEPGWNYTDEFIIHELSKAFNADSWESSNPISFDVVNSNQIRQMFSDISYSKGACLNRMLNNIIGEEKFKSGLIKYLNNYKYSNADAENLFQAFTIEAQEDKDSVLGNYTIEQIMEPWVKLAGFPVVTATRNYYDETVSIKQERFYITRSEESKQENGNGNGSLWWIPISYTTRAEQDFSKTEPRIWLKSEPEDTFHISAKNNSWILLNLKQTGYYVVNYDSRNWDLLIRDYVNLPSQIQAQLIMDSMFLAKANLLNYEVPLKILIQISKDRKSVPLLVAFNQLKYLDQILTSTPSYGKFNTFLSARFNNIYDSISFQENPNEPYAEKRVRKALLKWACNIKNSRCVARARHLFRAWMTSEQETNSISANTKNVVYCTAIREGGTDEWDFAYNQYLKTNQVSEKTALLHALGCASEPWLLSSYLEMILKNDSGIRKQDGNTVFNSVAENYLGHDIAFKFLRKRWNELVEYYGDGFNRLTNFVKSCAIYMHTPDQLAQLENFKNENINKQSSATEAFEQVIEKVKGNIAFMENSYGDIEAWLKKMESEFHYNK